MKKRQLFIFVFFLVLWSVFGLFDRTSAGFDSDDLGRVYSRYSDEFRAGTIFPENHKFLEYALGILIYVTSEQLSYNELFLVLFTVQIVLLASLAATFERFGDCLLFAVFVLVFFRFDNSMHLFRQYTATLLVMLASAYTSRRRVVLLLAAVTFHFPGTVIAVLYQLFINLKFRQKRILAIALVLIVGAVGMMLLFRSYLEPVLKSRYGFFFRDYQVQFVQTYTFKLIKYFILATLAGAVVGSISGDTRLFKIGFLGITITVLGAMIGTNHQFIFRFVSPLKFVFLPYYAVSAVRAGWPIFRLRHKPEVS